MDRFVDITQLDHPIEHDCPDCGDHMVIDPKQVRRFLAKAKRRGFRCAGCGERWPMRGMGAIMPGPPMRGVCVACEAKEAASHG